MLLAGNKRRLPNATFLTIRPGKHPKIFLGASIEGAGKMKGVIQLARWKWMKNEGRIELGDDSNESLVVE